MLLEKYTSVVGEDSGTEGFGEGQKVSCEEFT